MFGKTGIRGQEYGKKNYAGSIVSRSEIYRCNGGRLTGAFQTEEGCLSLVGVHSEVVDTNGSGHGALAGVLNALNADVLICGGIGGGAQTALAAAGIKLFGGVSGDADKAVEAFINDTLDYNSDVKCSHHEHNHEEGHTCGEHGCGSHSCH